MLVELEGLRVHSHPQFEGQKTKRLPKQLPSKNLIKELEVQFKEPLQRTAQGAFRSEPDLQFLQPQAHLHQGIPRKTTADGANFQRLQRIVAG